MFSHRESRASAQGRDDLQLAREALDRLSPSRADDGYTWLKVGMVLHSIIDTPPPDWIAWRRQSDKFNEGECEKQWRSFKAERRGP